MRRARILLAVAACVVATACVQSTIVLDAAPPEPPRQRGDRPIYPTPGLALGGTVDRWIAVPSGYEQIELPASARGRAEALVASPSFADAAEYRLVDATSQTADLVVGQFDGNAFTRPEQLDEVVAGLVGTFGAGRPSPGRLAGRVAWTAGNVVGFHDDGIAVIGEGPAARAAMIALVALGSDVPAEPVTGSPLVAVGQTAVFVDLVSASFGPLPELDPDDPDPFEVPPLPPFDFVATFPSGRLIGIGAERRGVAFSFELDPAVVASVDDRERALAFAAAASGPAESSVVAGRVVHASLGPDGPIRLWGVGTTVVVVFGDDEVVIDAIVDEWLRRLAADAFPR